MSAYTQKAHEDITAILNAAAQDIGGVLETLRGDLLGTLSESADDDADEEKIDDTIDGLLENLSEDIDALDTMVEDFLYEVDEVGPEE